MHFQIFILLLEVSLWSKVFIAQFVFVKIFFHPNFVKISRDVEVNGHCCDWWALTVSMLFPTAL